MSATGLYLKYEQASRKADVDLLNHRISAALVDLTKGYLVDLEDDEFLDDLPADSIISLSVLTGKSVGTDGSFEADDSVFVAEANCIIGAILLVHDTGLEASSRLLYYDDQAAGLPLVTSGSDVVVKWPTPIFV